MSTSAPSPRPLPDDVPQALLEAFEGRLTINAPRLCAALPMDFKTLKKHIAAGELVGRVKGTGQVHRHWVFTLADVMRFLRRPATTMSVPCQSIGSRTRPTGNSTSRLPGFATTDRPASGAEPKRKRSRRGKGVLPNAKLLQFPTAGGGR